MTLKVRHPCRNKCSHSVGDAICKGCGRTLEEVRDWGTYSPEKKQLILEQIEVRKR